MPTRAQQRRAMQAADELLNDLGVDQERPVDVFELLDQCGLWLTFTRLENLLGAAVRVGDGGVLLNTQRPRSVQRYTAAHELGHWVLDLDPVALDGEPEVFHPSTDREILAQVFAGQLLMPPPLVFNMCDRYGITGSATATGTSVYQAARDMGTSYEAAARQLANLKIIGPSDLDELLRQRPKDLKTALALGHAPTGAVELWTAGHDASENPIRVTAGDEVVVSLPENRTTGHRWLTDPELDARARHRESPAPEPFGADNATPTLAPDHLLAAAPTRPAAAITKALARLPGNTGHRRTMPSLPAQTPHPQVPTAERAATQFEAASLTLLDDRYRAGWATIAPDQTRGVRQAIAGRRDLNLPDQVERYSTGQLLDPRTLPVGSTGLRLLAFKAAGEGTSSFRFSYTSASNPAADTLDSYNLDVEVEPDPATLRRRQVIQRSLAEPDDAL